MTDLIPSEARGALATEAARLRQTHLRRLFDEDPQRARRLSVEACGLFLDYSKQRIDDAALAALLQLAEACELPRWRARLFSGEHVNQTEDRAALHMALRAPRDDPRFAAVAADVHGVLDAMERFAEAVRSGAHAGASGETITDIVNIGIGGSDFGPRMVCTALAPQVDGPLPHFIANVDGAELHALLARLDPRRTLFIVTSKTFTTVETIANARRAREWIVSALGEGAVARHFVAVSTNADAVQGFGIAPEASFGFWDWVGGRYSLWSAVGLSIMLALGPQRFRALGAGAYAMDQHFCEAPLARNLPVLLGLLASWNVNFLGCASQVVVPYAQRMSLFCGWLQQLEMESNGKRVDRAGKPVDHLTTPALWGSVGTNAQHAYFQMLHQGPAVHAIDFILPQTAEHPYGEMQRMLVANCLAQSAALMRGKTADEVRAELGEAGLVGDALEAAIPHRVFPGNRPSNTLLLPRLDAYHLGALLALYEHRCFVQSVIWNINPFDQWGVELGKQLAKRILDPAQLASMDPSTRALWARIHAGG